MQQLIALAVAVLVPFLGLSGVSRAQWAAEIEGDIPAVWQRSWQRHNALATRPAARRRADAERTPNGIGPQAAPDAAVRVCGRTAWK